MAYETVLLECSSEIARLTLNRPEKFNSFTTIMHAELRHALGELAARPPRVLIVAGAGKAFCAGQDLSERAMVARGETIDLGATLESNFNPLVTALRQAPYPSIAQVQGVAAGAGSSLALACDLAIAARSATFVQSFVRVGLAPDAGGSWQLVQRVGMTRALGLAMLGEKLSATQAADWGLIWQCVDDDALEQAVQTAAGTLAEMPRNALLAIRRLAHAAAGNTHEQQLLAERDEQRQLGHTADYREGITAFLAKRTPRYG